ncbi:MAG TPA: HNH endonuclease [bacterium]|nr:HNH endonuclease [Candidatus Omnitrophota bacterium]HOJ59329.1 HNH endonuclease [bacterium]HOL96755.1 HNH endonuclease [bacterium]HPP00140.1 HNH endonuclease [bacterium]HXK94279.1 HNH endonuclease [bacterium]
MKQSEFAHHRVLVLNSSYEAINICTARRAIVMLLTGKADVVENAPHRVRASSLQMPLPEVIRIRRFIKLPYRPIPFCRKNIMLRDAYSCQYCGEQLPSDELTLDHVIPLSRGGKDTWNNVVTACKRCNHKKGNNFIEEIGMTLVSPPRKPTLPTFLHLVRLMGEKREVWRKYLFYDDEPSAEAVV